MEIQQKTSNEMLKYQSSQQALIWSNNIPAKSNCQLNKNKEKIQKLKTKKIARKLTIS
jgi:hypothetical protein